MNIETVFLIGYSVLGLLAGFTAGVFISRSYVRPRISRIQRKVSHLQRLNNELNKELIGYHMAERYGGSHGR